MEEDGGGRGRSSRKNAESNYLKPSPLVMLGRSPTLQRKEQTDLSRLVSNFCIHSVISLYKSILVLHENFQVQLFVHFISERQVSFSPTCTVLFQTNVHWFQLVRNIVRYEQSFMERILQISSVRKVI